MIDTKICSHCGEEKPLSSFRHYYGGRKGTYKYCKDCEKIITREKYLVAKGVRRTPQEEMELQKIHKLYELRVSVGLEAPRHSDNRVGTVDLIDQMLAKAEAMKNAKDV